MSINKKDFQGADNNKDLEIKLNKSSSYDMPSSIKFESSSEENFKSPNEYIFESIGMLSNSKNSSSKGLFKSIADSFTNLKDTLKFNYITLNNRANLKKDETIFVGGAKFNKSEFKDISSKSQAKSDKQSSKEINEFVLKNYIYLSYRSGFSELKSLSNTSTGFSSDCGWGCMIRSAQMILARAIYSTKLHNYNSSKNFVDSNISNLCKVETILLLSDNFLTTSDILGNSDFDFYKIKKHNANYKPTRISSLIHCDIIDADEIDSYFVNKMIPPFSIQLISMLGELYGKGAGKTFSDINCVKMFEELNSEFKPIPNLDIMWTENIVSEEEIVKKFLEKVTEPKKFEKYYMYHEESYKLKSYSSRQNCFSSKNEEALAVSGTIFISIRLGLSNITSEYFTSIIKTFSIQGNLGMIGGENNKGFYYIGANSNNELIFLDPHFNQKSFSSKDELIDTYQDSYSPYYIYKIKINKISPAFTLGFNFNNINEFSTLMTELRQLSVENYPLLKLVDKKKEPIQKSLICTEVDDFDLIDFEEIDQASKL